MTTPFIASSLVDEASIQLLTSLESFLTSIPSCNFVLCRMMEASLFSC